MICCLPVEGREGRQSERINSERINNEFVRMYIIKVSNEATHNRE